VEADSALRVCASVDTLAEPDAGDMLSGDVCARGKLLEVSMTRALLVGSDTRDWSVMLLLLLGEGRVMSAVA